MAAALDRLNGQVRGRLKGRFLRSSRRSGTARWITTRMRGWLLCRWSKAVTGLRQWNHLGTGDADGGRTQQARRYGARGYREAHAGSGGDGIAIAGGNQKINRACGESGRGCLLIVTPYYTGRRSED